MAARSAIWAAMVHAWHASVLASSFCPVVRVQYFPDHSPTSQCDDRVRKPNRLSRNWSQSAADGSLRGTSCGRMDRRNDNLTNYQCDLTRVQTKSHVRPAPVWREVWSERASCHDHVARLVYRWRLDANHPLCRCLHTDWPAMNRHKFRCPNRRKSSPLDRAHIRRDLNCSLCRYLACQPPHQSQRNMSCCDYFLCWYCSSKQWCVCLCACELKRCVSVPTNQDLWLVHYVRMSLCPQRIPTVGPNLRRSLIDDAACVEAEKRRTRWVQN